MAMVRVECENRNKKRRVDLSYVKKTVSFTIGYLKIKGSTSLNIVFVSDQKIRALNRKYLGSDRATDVIAFWQGEGSCTSAKTGEKFLGDIAISTDRALFNAKKFDTSYKYEVLLYVVHGVLHLLGYEDSTRSGKLKMKRIEDDITEKIKKFKG